MLDAVPLSLSQIDEYGGGGRKAVRQTPIARKKWQKKRRVAPKNPIYSFEHVIYYLPSFFFTVKWIFFSV